MVINVKLREEVRALYNNLFLIPINQNNNNVSTAVKDGIILFFMNLAEDVFEKVLSLSEYMDSIKDENTKLEFCKKILQGNKVRIPGQQYEFGLWGFFYDPTTGEKINRNKKASSQTIEAKLNLQPDEVFIGIPNHSQWELYTGNSAQRHIYHTKNGSVPNFMVFEKSDEGTNKNVYCLVKFTYLTDKIMNDWKIAGQYGVTVYGEIPVTNPKIEPRSDWHIIKLEGKALEIYKNAQI